MDCARVVASNSRLFSPPRFAARPTSHATAPVPGRLFALPGPRSRRRLPPLVAASRRGYSAYNQDDGNDPSFTSSSASRMVDEGMLVLRKRIRDAEMAEMNYDPPEEWADWERAYYVRYGSDVCAALGFLQSLLLTTRPAVALGAAAVIALSLPVSAGAVVFAVVQGARAVVAGMGLC